MKNYLFGIRRGAGRAVAILLAVLLFAAPALAIPRSGNGQLALLQEISELMTEYALYPSGDLSLRGITSQMLANDEGLFMKIVNSWLAEDRYGYFLSAEEYMSRFTGEHLYGIGISVDASMPLGVYVEYFLPGGGAASSGMEVGAQIVFVDGTNIADIPFEDCRSLFLGPRGTVVEIGYINPGSSEVIYEDIRRRSLTVDRVQGQVIEGTDIGYISIERFGPYFDSYQFDYFYNDFLPKNKAKSVIIDLRGNPGGQLDTLTAMLNVMLPDEGFLLCSQVSKKGSVPIYSTGWDEKSLAQWSGMIWKPEKIVILVDEDSASASEVFAGTLQAYGLAVLVGQTTYGKSHSQYHIDLSTGDIIIFTVSRIELYKIGSYSDVGIVPNHLVPFGKVTGAEAGFLPLDTSRALFSQSSVAARVTAVQERLAFIGYYRAEPSGAFDDYTLWAINRFQAAHNLEQGRFANTETLRELDKAALRAEMPVDTQLEFALGLLIK
jgi:carboxyl-terminal processing protease